MNSFLKIHYKNVFRLSSSVIYFFLLHKYQPLYFVSALQNFSVRSVFIFKLKMKLRFNTWLFHRWARNVYFCLLSKPTLNHTKLYISSVNMQLWSKSNKWKNVWIFPRLEYFIKIAKDSSSTVSSAIFFIIHYFKIRIRHHKLKNITDTFLKTFFCFLFWMSIKAVFTLLNL